MADVPQMPGVQGIGESWAASPCLSIWQEGKAGEPASRGQAWGGRPGERGTSLAPGVLKPPGASIHLEPQTRPISLSWGLDLHRISDESRTGPNLGENGLQGKQSRLELEHQPTIWSLSLAFSVAVSVSVSIIPQPLCLPPFLTLSFPPSSLPITPISWLFSLYQDLIPF